MVRASTLLGDVARPTESVHCPRQIVPKPRRGVSKRGGPGNRERDVVDTGTCSGNWRWNRRSDRDRRDRDPDFPDSLITKPPAIAGPWGKTRAECTRYCVNSPTRLGNSIPPDTIGHSSTAFSGPRPSTGGTRGRVPLRKTGGLGPTPIAGGLHRPRPGRCSVGLRGCRLLRIRSMALPRRPGELLATLRTLGDRGGDGASLARVAGTG